MNEPFGLKLMSNSSSVVVGRIFDKLTIAEQPGIVNRKIEKALTFALRFLRARVRFFVPLDSSLENARRLAYTIAIHPTNREGRSMGKG